MRMYASYKMSHNEMDLSQALKQLLEEELVKDDPLLEIQDLQEILNDDPDVTEDVPRPTIFGYPTRPLYREIGAMLQQWQQNRRCPVLDLPNYHLLDENDYIESRAGTIEAVTPLLASLQSLWSLWSNDERHYRLREIIQRLGKRGLLDLLGMRKTVGSYESWPPTRKVIEDTFRAKHSPTSSSMLTVGARALAKHCHRDQSSSWWGASSGSESTKNDHAESILSAILDDAAWLNIHQLPHDVKVIEVRQKDGYGVRWSYDGSQFRGFLEPQMEDGHDVGWKH